MEADWAQGTHQGTPSSKTKNFSRESSVNPNNLGYPSPEPT